jgi:hypothetical protein
VLSLVFSVLFMLEGIARFVAFVEFWRAIQASWSNRREKRKRTEKDSSKA